MQPIRRIRPISLALQLALFSVIFLSHPTHASPTLQYHPTVSLFRPMSLIDSILPPQLTHYVRPVVMLGQDAVHGLAHGFLNWDWDRPFFNLYDGLNVLTAMAKVYKLYKDNGDDYDIYQNLIIHTILTQAQSKTVRYQILRSNLLCPTIFDYYQGLLKIFNTHYFPPRLCNEDIATKLGTPVRNSHKARLVLKFIQSQGLPFNIILCIIFTYCNFSVCIFYDIAIMYNYNMNFVNTGGIGSGTLYLMSPIIKGFIIANKADWMLLPFFAYFGVQWISDILIMYDTFDFRFSNHYDLRNVGYLVGKVASNYLNLMAFIDLVQLHEVIPRTRQL